MKKYLFGILAIAIAIGFSAFTVPKKTTYRFVINTTPSSSTVVEDVTASGGGINQDFYTNWEISAVSCGSETQDQACAIEVDQQYTHLESGVRVLNAATSGSAIAFPMNLAVGHTNPTRYIVSTGETGLINVINKAYN